jgi:hypothetical protein
MGAPDLAGDSISVHVRHAIVNDHKVDGITFEEPQTQLATAGCDHIVASAL